jgi:hypothetical protein
MELWDSLLSTGYSDLYPLKIKKIISRTKFESAQKRDASEFIPVVERLGLLETDTMLSHVLGSGVSLMIERVLWGRSAMLKETFIIDWKHL